ncbi:MAG: uracil-DNA glycosylase, partial [Bacilli bacterium]
MNVTWQDFFQQEKSQAYAQALTTFLDQAYAKQTIYPPRSQMYRAFTLCPVERLKVVIIGQDPY